MICEYCGEKISTTDEEDGEWLEEDGKFWHVDCWDDAELERAAEEEEMKASRGSITYTLDLGDLGEQDFDISYLYTPGDPGQVSGPPEKCWPPESSEFEITRLNFQGSVLTGAFSDLVCEFLREDTDFHETLDETEAESDDYHEPDE